MSKSKVDPCGVCSLRAKANSVLCLQCGELVHSRCDGVKRATPKYSRNITRKKCEGNIGEAVKQEVKLCDEVETVSGLTYLGDRMSASGGCEAALTARNKCRWAKFRECGELMHGSRFLLKLKGTVCKSYLRPAIRHRSEAWCQKESEMEIL